MFKKAIPLVLMSGLVLTACADNDTVPNDNETPMQNLEDRNKDDRMPRVNDEQTGPDLDGLDNNQDMNGNGDGIINDNNGTGNGVINDTNQHGNGIINDGNTTTPREDIIIEDDRDQQNR